MEINLICLAAALIGGLMLSRLTKLVGLPAVTAYLVAGLVLGPFVLGALGVPGLGFNSLEQVEHLNVITNTALGFIAFTIGNEFRLSQLKATGAGLGHMDYTQVLRFAKKEKPFIHATLENTTPENAASCLKFLQDQYDSIV